MATPYSQNDKDEIIDLYQQGYSSGRIRLETSKRCPKTTRIQQWIVDKDSASPTKTRKHFPYPIIGSVVAGYHTAPASMTQTAVARAFGVEEFNLRHWVKWYSPDPAIIATGDIMAIKQATIEMVSTSRKKSRAKMSTAHHTRREVSPDDQQAANELAARALTTQAAGEHDRLDIFDQTQVPGPIIRDDLPDDPDELKALLVKERLQHAVAAQTVVILGKDDALKKGNKIKAMIIDQLRATNFTLRELLTCLNIAKSSYDYARKHLHQAHADRQITLVVAIKAIATTNGIRYGYRKVYHGLKRAGMTVSEKIVRRIMRELGLCPPARVGSKFSSYEGENDVAPMNRLRIDGAGEFPGLEGNSQFYLDHHDTLTHDFHADEPNRVWVTDVSEIKCVDGKVYLSPMIDCFDGYPVAFAVSERPNMDLVCTMLEHALATLGPGEKPVVHSDRGFHYRAKDWVRMITTDHSETLHQDPLLLKVLPSMSRKGTSGDNARAEGFFGTLKRELLTGRPVMTSLTKKEMISVLDDYHDWYIHDRLNASLGYVTLAEHRGLSPVPDYLTATAA